MSEPLPGWASWLIVGAVFAVVLLLTRFNGWAGISERYPSTRPFPKKPVTGLKSNLFYRHSAVTRIHRGRIGTDFGLRACADESGLYFEPMLIFRLVHRAAFIPWQDVADEISDVPVPAFLAKFAKLEAYRPVMLRFKRVPEIQLQMTQDVVRQLKEQSGGAWKS